MPDARLNVNPDGVAPQNVGAGDLPGIIKDEERELAFEDDEGFRLRGIAMPVRGDVRSAKHHVQEAMGIIVRACVEVVISAQARRPARALNQRRYQCQVEKL